MRHDRSLLLNSVLEAASFYLNCLRSTKSCWVTVKNSLDSLVQGAQVYLHDLMTRLVQGGKRFRKPGWPGARGLDRRWPPPRPPQPRAAAPLSSPCSQLPFLGHGSAVADGRGRTPRTFGSEAGEGLEQLGEAEVVEAGEPLGFVAAQRGDAGNEGVGDELLHRLHALGHGRGRAPGLRPTSEPSLPQPPPPPPPARPAGRVRPRSRACSRLRAAAAASASRAWARPCLLSALPEALHPTLAGGDADHRRSVLPTPKPWSLPDRNRHVGPNPDPPAARLPAGPARAPFHVTVSKTR